MSTYNIEIPVMFWCITYYLESGYKWFQILNQIFECNRNPKVQIWYFWVELQALLHMLVTFLKNIKVLYPLNDISTAAFPCFPYIS